MCAHIDHGLQRFSYVCTCCIHMYVYMCLSVWACGDNVHMSYVCSCVCAGVSNHVSLYVLVFVWMRMYLCLCVYDLRPSVDLYHLFTCILQTKIHIHIFVVSIHTCLYVYLHVCICVYIYIYTFIYLYGSVYLIV